MPATSIQTPPAAPPPVEEPIKARKSKAKVVEEPEEEVAPAKRGRGRPKKVAPVKRGRKAAVVEAEDEADAPEDDTEAIDATEKSTAAPANTQFSSPYAAEPVRKPGSPPSYSLISQQQHQQPLTLVLPTPIPALHEIAPALLKSGVLSIQKVEKMTLAELFEECKSEGILDLYSNQKDAVAGAVKRARLRKHGFMLSAGCIEVLPDGFGFLRPAHNDYLPSTDDVFVSQAIIKRHGLKTGHMVEGAVRPPKDNEKYLALSRVDTVNEEDPSVSLTKTPFEELTPIYPNSRLVLETNAETIETRIIDLISPIGKGQRGLIVSPPRAGKTVLLQKIANAISKNNPECHLLVLLVDERPEEVTDMERSINGEVIASTFDEPASRHVQVCHMVIQKAKRMVEFGKDVVILLDSITRMARAHNIETPSSSKILSGGIDAGALQKPKQFFGSARNIEEGGSLTVLGTALIDTGSRMDEVIFEEFKGTGNMELVLDRRLADRRIFPALDINMSGTRREDLLMAPDELQRSWVLRRFMNDISDPVEAMDLLLEKIKKTKTNAEFLLSLDVGR
ncbi:MAG: transcription termination factor Rho [Planctomycetes bacterium]|nr:transcription termination factor Rho [Planctomycetota bacterium]